MTIFSGIATVVPQQQAGLSFWATVFAAVVAGVIILAIGWLVQSSVAHWRQDYAFDLRFSEETSPSSRPVDLAPGIKTHWQCPPGRHVLLVCVRAKMVAEDTAFDLRFVQREWVKWGRFVNAPQDVIEVTALDALTDLPEPRRDFLGPIAYEIGADGKGGFRVTKR